MAMNQIQIYPNGPLVTAASGKAGDQLVSELHGKYYQQTYSGAVFSAGSGSTALSANTITLVAATTPIVGVWNPPTSSVNLSVLYAQCLITVVANTAVNGGGFVWATSVGNISISTGAAPFNRKTFQNAGSQAKAFNGGVALTGLTNSLVVQCGANFPGIYAAGAATALGVPSPGAPSELLEGSFIVPPGGVLALLNTVSTTTLSVQSTLVWEETAL